VPLVAWPRNDAVRRGRGRPSRVVGRAGREQRPHHAVLLERQRARELLGDGGHDPARAKSLLGAQGDRSVRQRVRAGVGLGQQQRRVGARVFEERPYQRAAGPRVALLALEAEHGQRHQRRLGVQVAQRCPGEGVERSSGGGRGRHGRTRRSQPTLCVS
jgi:hypothetical protein